MTKEGDAPETTGTDVRNDITDVNGNVIATYDNEFTVFNAGGEEIGFIDANNNVCDLNENEIATVNEEYVVEDEEEAEVLAAAAPAETPAEAELEDEASTDLAEYETQDVDEYDDYDDEDEGEYEPISMEQIDEVIDTLHKRGMPMLDTISYPADALDLDYVPEEYADPNGTMGLTEEFIASEEFPLSLYRYLIDQIMDELAPRDENDNRDYMAMTEDGYEKVIQFSAGRTKELTDLADKIEKEKDIAFDFSATLEEVQETFENFNDKDKGFMGRLNNLGNSNMGKKVKEGAQWVKENPGKTAAGGAAAVIAGLPALAAGAAGYAGLNFWQKRKAAQEADPLIKEIQALKKELKPMRGKIDEAFEKLEKAQSEITRLQGNTNALKSARLITHRRLCVFIAASEELERQLEEEAIPAAQAELEQTGSKTAENKVEMLEGALDILKSKLTDMTNARLLGENEAQSLTNMSKGYAKAELKIRSHMSETKPEMKIQLAKADQILSFSSIGEILLHVDKLSDDMVAKSTAMGEMAGKTVRKVASRSTIDSKLLIAQRQAEEKNAAQIEASTRASNKADRNKLLTAAKEAGEKAGKSERRKILKELEDSGQGKSSAAKRLRLTNAANDAAKGEAEKPKQAAGGARRRKRKTPGAPKGPNNQ